MNKRLVTLVKDMGYLTNGIPQDEASQKCLKCLINTRLLTDACTKEERKTIFGISQNSFVGHVTSQARKG